MERKLKYLVLFSSPENHGDLVFVSLKKSGTDQQRPSLRRNIG